MTDPEANESSPATAQCSDFGTAATRTVTLAFRLVGDTATNIGSLLEDRRLQEAIAGALRTEAETIMREQNALASGQAEASPVGGGDAAMRLLGAVAGSEAVRNRARLRLENSAPYRRLSRSLNEFQCAFDQTPVGVFVNDNQTWLIVTGAVGAIAASAAMYYFESGDLPAQAVNLLDDTTLIKLGRIELGTGNVSFTPSERRIDPELLATARWTHVTASVRLSSTFVDGSWDRAGGSTEIAVQVNRDVRLNLSGSGSWMRDHDDDTVGEQRRIEGSLQLGGSFRLSQRANLRINVTGTVADTAGQISGRLALRSGLNLELDNAGRSVDLSLDLSSQTRSGENPEQPHFGPAGQDSRVMLGLTLNF